MARTIRISYLPKLEKHELESIMCQLSFTKAIACEGLYNIMFSTKKENDPDSNISKKKINLENLQRNF